MMYAKVLFVCISISCCVVGVQSARILGVSVLLSYSHQTFLRPLWKELLLRGHHLTVLTHQPMNDPLLTNLTEINLKKTNSQLKLANFIELMDVPSWILHYRFAEKFGKLIDSQLSNPKVQNLINDPNENFDLLIIEGYHTAYLAFSHRFKCPFISVITLEAFAHIHYEIGNPTHYALYPDYELGFSRHLTFFQRFQSLSYDIYYQLLLHYFTVPTQQRLVEKHFGINYPSIREIFKNYSICFLNSNSVIHPVRPLLPNVVQIWGKFHINKSKALAEELQDLLDRSTQGAIYFSLGSNVESRDMSNEILRSILKAFEELPYTILWKFEHDNLQNIPDNVVISKWFPQQDVLRHPNMKLFITQGGVHSFEEALNANLPLIGIPIMGDQKANCQELTFKGLGVMLEYKSITKDIFKSAILEVINNPKYKNAVKFYAQLATDQPETGLERAVWWTEYVLRHKGAPHLRNPAYDLPFYQYYSIDIISFSLSLILVTLYLSVKIFHFMLRLIKKLKSKQKQM